jgi:uncharacterized protein YecT (DUF1311 family)
MKKSTLFLLFLLFYTQLLVAKTEDSKLIQDAKLGDEKALNIVLDKLFFRVENFKITNPKQALDIFYIAKKANPKLKLYDEKEKLEVLKLASESKNFDAEEFMKKYNLKIKNNRLYEIWELAEEAAKSGRFGKAKPKLVFDLVVRGGEVPAELELAVRQTYKNWQNGIAKFNICDYITSGMGQGYCARRYEKKDKIKREKKLSLIKIKLDKKTQELLDKAYKTVVEFIDEKSFGEEGHGGSGRVAWTIESQVKQKNDYINLIKKVQKGFIPKLKHKLSFYDEELNIVYKKVMKKLKKGDIEYTMSYPITKENVRKIQRIWLRYRDNNVKLFTTLNPKSKKEDWEAYFTKKRTKQLKDLL